MECKYHVSFRGVHKKKAKLSHFPSFPFSNLLSPTQTRQWEFICCSSLYSSFTHQSNRHGAVCPTRAATNHQLLDWNDRTCNHPNCLGAVWKCTNEVINHHWIFSTPCLTDGGGQGTSRPPKGQPCHKTTHKVLCETYQKTIQSMDIIRSDDASDADKQKAQAKNKELADICPSPGVAKTHEPIPGKDSPFRMAYNEVCTWGWHKYIALDAYFESRHEISVKYIRKSPMTGRTDHGYTWAMGACWWQPSEAWWYTCMLHLVTFPRRFKQLFGCWLLLFKVVLLYPKERRHLTTPIND